MRTRPLRVLAAIVIATIAGGVAAADPPPPLGVADLTGPQTLALQAGVGLASQNEALFLNPAALAARKRFVVDSFYLTDRRPGLTGGAARQDYFGGSVADSATTRVAAGFGYARAMKGVETGTLLRLGLATQVTRGLSLGLQGNYFDLRGPERVKQVPTMDGGVFLQVSPKVSLGAAGYNLLRSKHREVLPRGWGAGIAVGSETSLLVAADWRMDLDRVKEGASSASDPGRSKATNRYSVGAQYLYAGAVPVRAGYEIDDVSKTRWWSAGAGYLTRRAAVELAWRQSTKDPRARTIALAIRIFVPNE